VDVVKARLQGKVALVTGGASGIGRAAALAFARESARVVVSDVDAAGGEQTVQAIRAAGGDAIFVRADVSQPAQVETLTKKVVETFHRLDCAFNNAGIQGRIATTVDCNEENWDRIVATNLKGVWLCMKYEIPLMLRQGGGAIVNTASNFGLVGSAGMPAYAASKHGVVGVSKVAALEYASRGIRVNAVCPGPIKTPLSEGAIREHPDAERLVEAIMSRLPARRWGLPEEVAEAVVWLCSDAASFVTGAVLPVDGAYVAQ
jgi:NAD(P)-dependent dehydrogenase (short-subunit alcohol dehydrogenase family)